MYMYCSSDTEHAQHTRAHEHARTQTHTHTHTHTHAHTRTHTQAMLMPSTLGFLSSARHDKAGATGYACMGASIHTYVRPSVRTYIHT